MKIKFIQRLYYSGKFQIFYQKAAVMDTLVLKPCPLRLYAPLRIHPSGSGLLLVKFWNCQSHITCEISNFQIHVNHILFMDVTSTIDKCPLSEFSRLVRSAAAVSSDVRHVTPVSIAVRRIINPSFSLSS